MEDYKIKKIKQEIEIKRDELNRTVIESFDQDKILKSSQELDVLISEYYLICKKAKTAES